MRTLTQLLAALQKLCATPGTTRVLWRLCVMLKWATLLYAIWLAGKILSFVSILMQ